MIGLAGGACVALLVGFTSVAAIADEGEANGGTRAATMLPTPTAWPRHWSPSMSRQDVLLGRTDPDHDDDYLYRLPYADDASFPIIQGYDAKLSHRGPERFTLDFGMPLGTPVHAAREGVIVLVEDSHNEGCAREECGRFANFVVLLHADGTTGEYFHLQQGSAQVRLGERVRRGQLLARSGNTGYSTAPHLHFGVYRTAADGHTESLAVRFKAHGGIVTVPRSGAFYVNLREPPDAL